MQALRPGLQIRQAWVAIDQFDFPPSNAFSITPSREQIGYLNACPPNLGTGIRVSAMLHLPALVLSNR